MCLCVYLCVWLYVCLCVWLYVCEYVYMHVYVCVSVCLRVWVYVSIWVCACLCVNEYVCVFVYVCLSLSVCMYIYMCIFSVLVTESTASRMLGKCSTSELHTQPQNLLISIILFHLCLGQDLTIYPRLALNLQSPCFSLPRVQITGLKPHALWSIL